MECVPVQDDARSPIVMRDFAMNAQGCITTGCTSLTDSLRVRKIRGCPVMFAYTIRQCNGASVMDATCVSVTNALSRAFRTSAMACFVAPVRPHGFMNVSRREKTRAPRKRKGRRLIQARDMLAMIAKPNGQSEDVRTAGRCSAKSASTIAATDGAGAHSAKLAPLQKCMAALHHRLGSRLAKG